MQRSRSSIYEIEVISLTVENRCVPCIWGTAIFIVSASLKFLKIFTTFLIFVKNAG